MSIWLGNRIMHASVNVFWSRTIGDNWWACGGHLIVSTLDLAKLHMGRRLGDLRNRRKHERLPFCHCFSSVFESNESSALGSSKASEFEDIVPSIVSLDVSTGGMRLVSDEPFGFEGNIVLLQNKSDLQAGPVRGRIVSFFEMENGYYSTGVQFLN